MPVGKKINGGTSYENHVFQHTALSELSGAKN